jgi:methyl-accepting chemotaxis protein
MLRNIAKLSVVYTTIIQIKEHHILRSQKESAAAANRLSALAGNLRRIVSQFKIK